MFNVAVINIKDAWKYAIKVIIIVGAIVCVMHWLKEDHQQLKQAK